MFFSLCVGYYVYAHLPQTPLQEFNSCQAVLLLTLVSLTSQIV